MNPKNGAARAHHVVGQASAKVVTSAHTTGQDSRMCWCLYGTDTLGSSLTCGVPGLIARGL